MNKLIQLNTLLLTLLLSACGGGGDSSVSETLSNPIEPVTVTLTETDSETETETDLAESPVTESPSIEDPIIDVPAIEEPEIEEPIPTGIPLEVSSVLRLPEFLHNYSDPNLPAHFNTAQVQGFDNTPLDNIITDDIATLGRVLFYEKQLSANATVACASCHLQANGFSDPNRFSIGFQGVTTSRNSMGLANSKYYERGHFFWDERADTLEDQVLEPIQNGIEMGLTLEQAESNIIGQNYYPYLFEQAFGDNTVTSERMSLALSQFVRSLISYESKYDAGVASNFINFSATENRGRGLFNSNRTNCAACHVNNDGNGNNQAILQPDRTFNNGLDAALVNDDNGVGDVVNNQNQNGRFKIGSLRNIELTAPYMHDGRFNTLLDVVEHYNSGVQDHPNLDNRLQRNGNPVQMNLSDQDKEDLVAFMLTFTDNEFTNDEKFSNPFIFQ
ncbi:MAG: cytochrome c peroxidase [Cocleimonas sp.]|jgi:cytochrome c peroxidase